MCDYFGKLMSHCYNPAPLFNTQIIRTGDRVAEGAALEMLCAEFRTVGSNPTLSAQEKVRHCRAFLF